MAAQRADPPRDHY